MRSPIALHERHEADFASRDEVLATQDRKLAALGRRLAEHPEWAAHFRAAGVAGNDLTGREALRHFPTLEKADLRARYPFHCSRCRWSR